MVARNNFFSYISAMLLVLQSLPGTAQVKCKIEHYGPENGLSHNSVTSIIKSSDGFMWFGTWDGINRFDGHNFINYKPLPGDSSGLTTNRIDRIVEDHSGYLWLRPNDLSISRFDKKTAKLLSITNILSKQKIYNIKFDKIIPVDGEKVWLTTIDKGVFCVNKAIADTPTIDWYASGKEVNFALPADSIRFLYEDKQHNIWVGTNKGLCMFFIDPKGHYKKQSINSNLVNNISFTSVTEGTEHIWFGTTVGTLVFYEKSSGQLKDKKIGDHAINALCLSKKNNVLYASTGAKEIITVNISSLEIEKATMTGVESLHAIYEDRSGLLWIEPEKKGIIKYDPSFRSFKLFTQKSDAQLKYQVKLYGVFEDNEDRVWVMMQSGGFGYYNPSKDEVEYFYDEPGAANHRFSNIIGVRYYDPSGIFWFTTSDRGIEKIIFQQNGLDPKLLIEGTTDKTDNEVRGIYNDHKNRIWITSKSGALYIQQYDGKRLSDFFINEPTEGIGSVYAIAEDKKGRVWLGTKGNGLFVAEPLDSNAFKYKLTHYLPDKNDPYSISSNTIYSLLEDSKGRMLVGTFENGLNLVKETKHKIAFINSKNELGNFANGIASKVRHMFEDAAGKLWIACTNGLVIADINDPDYTGYKFVPYQKKSGDKLSLSNNDLQFILKDSKRRMWIGTSGGGLDEVILKQDTTLEFKAFTKKDGLPSDYILSIVEDNLGNLWLGTENGLCKFNPDKFTFRNFDSYEGLMTTGFSEASGTRLSNGNLLFGTINGYLVFNPQQVANKKINAGMAFTNLQINNKDVVAGADGSNLKFDINNTSEIKLAYNENIISIDFAILDYRSNDKQTFAYRLTGFDKDWNTVVNQHRATYTNLPPGTYTFEVKSLSDDLYEKPPFKSLAITIFPPWWRTWWAYAIYVLLLIILVEIVRRVAITMIRLRNKLVVEQKLTELKIKFFTNISHELRTPLTLIVNPIEELIKQKDISPKSYQYLTVAHKNTSRMVRFINQLLDFQKVQNKKMILKIRECEIVSFVKDIASYFMEAANEKNIELSVTSNVDMLLAWIDPEKIDIVIYNLLSNAFKFSPKETKIEIQVNDIAGSDLFTIKVVDQGMGVPQDKLNEIFELYFEVDEPGTSHLAGTGIGLALSKDIVQLHHGKITAQNNTSKGLTVSVELHVSKDHFTSSDIIIIEPANVLQQPVMAKEPATYFRPVPENENHFLENDLPVVLIVEDNRELRKFLVGQLQTFYRVMEAEHGKDALKKLNQSLPDLILSDVMMPEMDGIELLDKLKNDVLTSHIPVILLTAKSSVESQLEGIRYGADYYITKPFNADLVVALIDNLLKQRKKLFEAILSGKQELPVEIEHLALPNQPVPEVQITAKDRAFLNEVIAIVEKNIGDVDFNIDKVAGSILMGRSTFYKKLKSLTNLSPVEFIKEIRLKRGKEILDEGENNIATVAYEVGFSNVKYFSSCFKDKYDVTPKEYLRQKPENKNSS